jgi:hypothetical protein
MMSYYETGKLFETIVWSAQLDKRDKDFSKLFLKSDIIHVS